MGAMKGYQLIVTLLVAHTIFGASAKPFLYNSGPLVLQSIFRSSSGLATGNTANDTNVEDLRMSTTTAAGDSDSAGKLDSLKADRNHLHNQAQTDATNNEAAPTLFQKKIDKILYKIRLLGQLSGNAGNSNPDNDKNDFDFDADDDDEDDVTNIKNVTKTKSTSTTIKPSSSTAAETDVEAGTVLPSSVNEVDRPQRLVVDLPVAELDTNNAIPPVHNDLANVDVGNNVDIDNQNKINPGTLGVYLMEMLGTVLTLIYGAAVQVNESFSGALANKPSK